MTNRDDSSSVVAGERLSPFDMSPETFRALAHDLVDRLAAFYASLPERPVTTGENPSTIREHLGNESLPETGSGDPARLLDRAANLLFEHSLLTGHPRFLGYIVGPGTPIGALGDLLAAAINPNVGGWKLSPMATEIERQTVSWIAELIGYPKDSGGLIVSGGNMANFVGFLAARRAGAEGDVRARGMGSERLRVYASKETHTWIQKAADLFGLGTDAIRWVDTDRGLRMSVAALRKAIRTDRAAGDRPFLVVGTAGAVSTGAIDPLADVLALCREEKLWFHVDGAYGGLGAALPEASSDLKALAEADSVAVDPHKWLYAPVEAGCALVRNPAHLLDTFSYRPPYYRLGADETNFYEHGMQNTRGFKALKIWLQLQLVGRQGYIEMIREDIRLAGVLSRLASAHPELEAGPQGLSITTFRYVPPDLRALTEEERVARYLDELNTQILDALQAGGEVFLTNAVVGGRFLLRTCVVNFRTSEADMTAIPEIVARAGREVDSRLRPAELARK